MTPVIELIKSHRSIRKYTKQTIDQETINKLFEAGQSASTSSFIQAYSVIQIKDPLKRKAMATFAGGQSHVEEAPAFFVFCADLNRIKYCCERHSQEFEAGYAEHFVSASVDTTLLAQNTVLAAESLGLGCVFVGGIRNDPDGVSTLLKLPKHVYPVFGLCMGYPDQNPQVKPRLPLQAILQQDEYPQEMDKALLEKYDNDIFDYYQTRSSANKSETWSEQIAYKTTKKSRPFMKKFLQDRGFFLK